MTARTVLVLRSLKLGDLLVAVPALRAIRRHWPHHRLLLATSRWLGPMVELIGGFELLGTHGLEPLGPAAHRPDVAINLHGAGPESTRLLDGLRPGRRIGHRGGGWDGPEWRDDLHERHRWCRLLTAHGIPADATDLQLPPPLVGSPAPAAVVVHPGAAYGSREWPVEYFAEVAARLADRGEHVVVTGGVNERRRAMAVASGAGLPPERALAGRTGLAELAALVADARLVVCADTGIAHLSYAYRTPSVVLFGPVPASRWGPPEAGPHIALSVDELRRGEPFADSPDPALLAVTPAAVLSATDRLLS